MVWWLLVVTVQIYNEKEQAKQRKVKNAQFEEKRSTRTGNGAKSSAQRDETIKEKPDAKWSTSGRDPTQLKLPTSEKELKKTFISEASHPQCIVSDFKSLIVFTNPNTTESTKSLLRYFKSGFCSCNKNTPDRKQLGRKVHFIFCNPLSREAKVGTEDRSLRQKSSRRTDCWLASYFSYTAWAHLSRDGTAHSGMNPPTSASNQENALQVCPQMNLMAADDGLSSQLFQVDNRE